MDKYNWIKLIPWFLTIACTVVLIVIGMFLIDNIQWFKESVFNEHILNVNEPEYRFYAHHLHLSMIKRSIGLFSGFATMFLGLGVAFFTLKDNTTFVGEGGGFSAKIITASPGIIALVVGAYLIVSTIDSKDSFPSYDQQRISIGELDKSKKPQPPNDIKF